MIAPQSEERSMVAPQFEEKSRASKVVYVIPPSVKVPSTFTPQKKRKTSSQSLVSSHIPQLDRDNKHINSESEPDPVPETKH